MRDLNNSKKSRSVRFFYIILNLWWSTPLGYLPLLLAIQVLMEDNKLIGGLYWFGSIALLLLSRMTSVLLCEPSNKEEHLEIMNDFYKYTLYLLPIGSVIGTILIIFTI